MVFLQGLRRSSVIILGFVFVTFFVSYGYCQVLNSESKELFTKAFEETKGRFATDPDNLKVAEEFIAGCAMLEKWDDFLPVYKRVSSRMSEEEKQSADMVILLFRTKQIDKILISSEKDDAQQYESTMIMRFLKSNPLEGLSKEIRSEIMDCFEKGGRLFQEGKITEGKAEFEKTHKLKETPFPALYTGMFLHSLGKSHEAIEYFEKGIELAGKEDVTPFVWVTLANAYINDGLKQKAVFLLEDRVKADPRDLFSLYQLADFYLKDQEDGKYLEVCEKIKVYDSVIFALIEDSCSKKLVIK